MSAGRPRSSTAASAAAWLAALALSGCEFSTEAGGTDAVALAPVVERELDDEPEPVPRYDIGVRIDEAGFGNRVEVSGATTTLVFEDVALEQLPQGAAVSFDAAPGPEHVFGGWVGDCAASALSSSCTLTIGGPMQVGALFFARRALSVRLAGFRGVALSPRAGAAIDVVVGFGGDPGYRRFELAQADAAAPLSLPRGATVTLTARIPDGGEFTAWSGCDAVESANRCVLALSGDRAVQAVFRPNHCVLVAPEFEPADLVFGDRLALESRVTEANGDPVAGSPECPAGCAGQCALSGQRVVAEVTEPEFAFTPGGPVFAFGQWTGPCAAPAPALACDVRVTGDTAITARFGARAELRVTRPAGVDIALYGLLAVSTETDTAVTYQAPYGAAARLRATAATSTLAFVRWVGCGDGFDRDLGPVCALDVRGGVDLEVVAAAAREARVLVAGPGALEVRLLDRAGLPGAGSGMGAYGETLTLSSARAIEATLRVPEGDGLRLSATANADPAAGPLAVFAGWSSDDPAAVGAGADGACAGTAADCAFTVSQDVSLTASFSAATLLEIVPLSSSSANAVIVGNPSDPFANLGLVLAEARDGAVGALAPSTLAATVRAPRRAVVPSARPLRLETRPAAGFLLGRWNTEPDPDAGIDCQRRDVCVVVPEPGTLERIVVSFYPETEITVAGVMADPGIPGRPLESGETFGAVSARHVGVGIDFDLVLATDSAAHDVSAAFGTELELRALDALPAHPGVVGHVGPGGTAALFSHWSVPAGSEPDHAAGCAPATGVDCRVLVSERTAGLRAVARYLPASTIELRRIGRDGAGRVELADGSRRYWVGEPDPARREYRLIAPAGSTHRLSALAATEVDSPADRADLVDFYRFRGWSRGPGCAGAAAPACVARAPESGSAVYAADFDAMRRFRVAVRGARGRVTLENLLTGSSATVASGETLDAAIAHGGSFSMRAEALASTAAFAGWRGPDAGGAGYPCGGWPATAAAAAATSRIERCVVVADRSMPAGATYTARFAGAAERFAIELVGDGSGSASAVAAQWSPPFLLSASLGAGGSGVELAELAGVPLGTRFSLRAAPAGDSLFTGWLSFLAGDLVASTSVLAIDSSVTAEGRRWVHQATFRQGALLTLSVLGDPRGELVVTVSEPSVALRPDAPRRRIEGGAPFTLRAGSPYEVLGGAGASARVLPVATTGTAFVRWLSGPCAGLSGACDTVLASGGAAAGALFSPLSALAVVLADESSPMSSVSGVGVSVRSGLAGRPLDERAAVSLAAPFGRFALPSQATLGSDDFPISAEPELGVELEAFPAYLDCSDFSAFRFCALRPPLFSRWEGGACAAGAARYDPACAFGVRLRADAAPPPTQTATFVSPRRLDGFAASELDGEGTILVSLRGARIAEQSVSRFSTARQNLFLLPAGGAARLEAEPEEGSSFSRWTGPPCDADPGNRFCEFTIVRDSTYHARFVGRKTLEFRVTPPSGLSLAIDVLDAVGDSVTHVVEATGTLEVDADAVLTVTARETADSRLSEWGLGCEVDPGDFRSCVVDARGVADGATVYAFTADPATMRFEVPNCPPGECGGARVLVRDARSGALVHDLDPSAAFELRSGFGDHARRAAVDALGAAGQGVDVSYAVADTSRVTLNDPPDRETSGLLSATTSTTLGSSGMTTVFDTPFRVWWRLGAGHHAASLGAGPGDHLDVRLRALAAPPSTASFSLGTRDFPGRLGEFTASGPATLTLAFLDFPGPSGAFGAAVRRMCAARQLFPGQPGRCQDENDVWRGFRCFSPGLPSRCSVELPRGVDLDVLVDWARYPLTLAINGGGAVNASHERGRTRRVDSSATAVMVGARAVFEADEPFDSPYFVEWAPGSACSRYELARCEVGPLHGEDPLGSSDAVTAEFSAEFPAIRVAGPGRAFVTSGLTRSQVSGITGPFPAGVFAGVPGLPALATQAQGLEWQPFPFERLVSIGMRFEGDLLGWSLGSDCAAGSTECTASFGPPYVVRYPHIRVHFRPFSLYGARLLMVGLDYGDPDASYRYCGRRIDGLFPGDPLGCPEPLRAPGRTTTDGVTVAVARRHTGFELYACDAAGACGRVASGDFAATAPTLFKAPNSGNSFFNDEFDFGTAVALSADGAALAVGAPLDNSTASTPAGAFAPGDPGYQGALDDTGRRSVGSAYVYRRGSTGRWAVEAYVKAPHSGELDGFGIAVALSADGATLAVGARGEDSTYTGAFAPGDPDYQRALDSEAQRNNAGNQSGAVYVYRRDSTGRWAIEAFVKAPNADATSPFLSSTLHSELRFGNAVALSGDGATLAVGAPFEDGMSNGVFAPDDAGYEDALYDTEDSNANFGAAYVYRRDSTGRWAVEAYVKPSRDDLGTHFGNVLALSADGGALAVGVPGDSGGSTGVFAPGGEGYQAALGDDNRESDSGAVYVYRRSDGRWGLEAYIKPPKTTSFGSFGLAAALSADGAALAVGEPGNDSRFSGIFAPGGDGYEDALDDGTRRNAGAAYVYRRSGGLWDVEAYIKAPVVGQDDGFGSAAALSADGATLAVGAASDDSAHIGAFSAGDPDYRRALGDNSVVRAGAAHVYRRGSDGRWAVQAFVKGGVAVQGHGVGGSGCGFALSADGRLAMAVPRHAGTLTNAAGAFDPAVDPGYEAALADGRGPDDQIRVGGCAGSSADGSVGAVFLY